MQTNVLITWFLATATSTIVAGQTQQPNQSAPAGEARLFSSLQQELPQRQQMLVIAKTVLVVVGEPSQDSSAKAEQALKKALMRWGRFQLVDDAQTADLIIVISDFSSSKRMMMDRVMESMAVFAGGTVPGENAAPLWSVDETGPALGTKRPTEKLVQDFKKDLTEFEKSVAASGPSSVSPSTASRDNVP